MGAFKNSYHFVLWFHADIMTLMHIDSERQWTDDEKMEIENICSYWRMSFNLSPLVYPTLDVWKNICKKHDKYFDQIMDDQCNQAEIDKLLSYVDIEAMIENYERKNSN